LSTKQMPTTQKKNPLFKGVGFARVGAGCVRDMTVVRKRRVRALVDVLAQPAWRGVGFAVCGLGLRVEGLGFRVSGLRFRVEGLFTVCGRTVQANRSSGFAWAPVYVPDLGFRV